jgi:hypothetical protein
MWGAGVLSVMGVSFTTVPVATSVVTALMAVRPGIAMCGLVLLDQFLDGRKA